jgi:iron complex outermembrane recepter protein
MLSRLKFASRSSAFALRKISSVVPLIAAANLGGALGAHAQTESTSGPNQSDSNELEAIVVTAERRAETVQDAPLSITAISSATIEKFDIQDFTDYAKDAPNLSFGMAVGGGGASFAQGIPGSLGFTIRGISGYDTTAFYIDDTPLPVSLDPRVLDIDHIEVLRGPQGTLFGASSMGGMVRLITQPPDVNNFESKIDFQGYDMSHADVPGGQASTVVNLPLVTGVAAVRLSAFDSYTPGYFERTYNDPLALNVTGQPVPGPAQVIDNVGASRQEGLGATFRVTPVDGVVLTPMFRWQKTTADGFPLADYNDDNLVQRRILDEPESYADEFYFAAFTASYTAPFGRVVSSASYFKRDFSDVEDGADANSVYLSPTHLLPAPSIGAGHSQILTQEARFESSFDFPLQVVGGVFHQDVRDRYFNTVVMPGLQGYGTDFVWNLDPAINNTTQLAGYIGLTYTPFKPLELQVGGRETHLTNYTYSFSNGVFGTGLGQTAVSENAFTPRYSAKYTWNPHIMTYLTAAQGFRIGGANVPLGSACGGFGFSTTEQIPYGPDDLWSYEAGIKITALDDRLSVRAAAFHIDWSRIQQSETLSNGAGGCFAGLTLNLGSAYSDGGELELTARVTDGLTVNLATGYDDARLTKVVPGTEYYVGEPLSGVPRWTANASFDYAIPQPWGNYFVRGQYSYTGSSVSYTEVATGLPRPSYELTDLRLGASFDRYIITVFAKNLFDARPNLSDEVPVSALACPVTGPCRYRYDVGLPREVGVDFRYRFGT